jgi:hypothetical protein
MPEVFLQGQPPYFFGTLCNDGEDVLNGLKDALQSAGWTITNNSIPSFFVAKGEYDVYDEFGGFIRTDNCWVKLTNNSGTKNIILNGDFDGTNTFLSPNILLPYSATNDFYLFLGCDKSAASFSIFNANDVPSTWTGSHFGFLTKRAANSDLYAISCGLLTNSGWLETYLARDFHTQSVKWHAVKDTYSSAVNWLTSGTANRPWGMLDYVTNGVYALSGDNDVTTSTNMAYYQSNGFFNGVNNKPVPCPYYLVSGRGAVNVYGSTGSGLKANKIIGVPLYTRGIVKYAKSGIRNAEIGQRILSYEELILSGDVGDMGHVIGRIKRTYAVLNQAIAIDNNLSAVYYVYNANTTFVLNTDFTVNLTEGTVTPLSSGSIPNNSIIAISYAL